MAFDAVIFDLDGTLLDTLPDLVNLTNTVLAEWGMPTHTAAEINSYVGNGARVMLTRAVPPATEEDVIDELLARWRSLYPEQGHKYTKPYQGIPEVLDALKREGVKLGVLSNKFDVAVCYVISHHFPGVFDEVRGERPDTPRKPDPTGLLSMIERLGVAPGRTAYVGDSGGDMTVALNAGAVPIGVTWGYRDEEELRQHGASALADAPADLLHVLF